MRYLVSVTVRIVALALVVALLGSAAAAADPGSSQPIAAEIDDGPAADLATPPRAVTIVLPIRRLIVVMPTIATLTPRLHVESLFRPPCA